MTLTTERANPLRQWNSSWGGCSTAWRPVAAVNKLFLRRSVFVKRCAADFIALLGMLAEAFLRAPVIVVICDNDSIHHARTAT